jgi:hypothetical protein
VIVLTICGPSRVAAKICAARIVFLEDVARLTAGKDAFRYQFVEHGGSDFAPAIVAPLQQNAFVMVAVATRSNEVTPLSSRVKIDNGHFSLLQLEGDLNLLMHFHVVWSVADAIHNMELDELFAVDRKAS